MTPQGRRIQVVVQLTDELVELVDAEAAARGVSRPAVIREVLMSHLAERREAEISRQIVEGHERVPPARPDEWGDLEALGDRATRDLAARLDDEERKAGHEPW